MRSRIAVVAIVSSLVGRHVLTQSPPAFEVASIRPADVQNRQVNAGVSLDGSQVRYRLVPLISYIGYAFDARNYQIVGPDWLRTQYFDVVAKLPAGASTKQVPQMLRTLLVDRFGLKSHPEKREFSVSALEVAKEGLRMHEAPRAAIDTDNNGTVTFSVVANQTGGSFDLGGGAYFLSTATGFEGKKMTMAQLAYMLTPFVDRPVIDSTSLAGRYDFALDISEEDRTAIGIRAALNAGVKLPPQMLRLLDNASGASLTDALRTLGLVLVSKKAYLDVIVVDEMQKTPSEN